MWQDNFAQALRNPDMPMPTGLQRWDGRLDDSGFAVYRNNVFVSLTEAIESGFGLIQKLVGDEFFRALARAYVGSNLPTSPVLIFYGADFADFLADFPPAQQIPYLPDVARLEYAMRLSTHAADLPWSSSQRSHAEVDPDALLARTITLHPSVQWVGSQYPLFDIYYRTQHDPENPIGNSAQDLLIYRSEESVLVEALPAGGIAFLDALKQQKSLAEACDLALMNAAECEVIKLVGLFTQLATPSPIKPIAS